VLASFQSLDVPYRPSHTNIDEDTNGILKCLQRIQSLALQKLAVKFP